MTSDTEQMVLQGLDSVLHILCDMFRTELILIELIRSGSSRPEALVAIAQTVRSGLYKIDEIGDSVRECLHQLQR